MGTTRTRALAGSRKSANAVVQPAGTPAARATGSGAGTIGTTAATARAAMSRFAHGQRARGHRARGQRARAASKPNANAAAAAPSATIENLSGSTDPLTG